MKTLADERVRKHEDLKRRRSLDGDQPAKQRKTFEQQTITNMVRVLAIVECVFISRKKNS